MLKLSVKVLTLKHPAILTIRKKLRSQGWKMLDEITKNFEQSDLQYYFESQQHDTYDLQGRSRRASEVLKIRDRLLSMPEKEFEAAIHAIRGILDPKTQKDGEDGKTKRRDAAELYDRARTEQASPMKMGSL